MGDIFASAMIVPNAVLAVSVVELEVGLPNLNAGGQLQSPRVDRRIDTHTGIDMCDCQHVT